jgi:two-component system KDP operon response regulator KdpE
VLDLGLPDLCGLDIISKIRETDSTPILVVSAMGDESKKIDALDLGADDYITKPFHTGELLARIRVIERRLKLMENEPPTRKLTIEYMTIDLEQGLLWIDGNEVHLTLIEFKLLRLLILNRGKVLTYNFIMNNIWGYGECADANNLRVCMASLRKKIERDTANPNFILTQIGIGYRFISV